MKAKQANIKPSQCCPCEGSAGAIKQQDDRLPTNYRLEKVAISPALANGEHQLFIETAQYQPTSSLLLH